MIIEETELQEMLTTSSTSLFLGPQNLRDHVPVLRFPTRVTVHLKLGEN
jgi:hypothetical protein